MLKSRVPLVLAATILMLSAFTGSFYYGHDTAMLESTRGHNILWDVYPLNGTLSGLRAVQWHPSGGYALAGGGGTLVRYYPNGTLQDISYMLPVGFDLRDLDFAPNGSLALLCGLDGMLLSFNGTAVTDISADLNTSLDIEGIAFSPNGTFALAVGKGVFLYSSGLALNLTGNATGNLSCVEWAPNGTIALAGGDEGLWTVEAEGLNFTKASGLWVNALGWNASSALISAKNLTSGARSLRTLSGNATLEVVPLASNVSCIQWSGDGEWLLGGDGLMSLNGTGLNTLSVTPPMVAGLAQSPDGTSVLLACSGLYVYQYRNDAPVLTVQIPGISMLEDNETSGQDMLNLSAYFGDDHDTGSLNYSVSNLTNSSALDIWVNGSMLCAQQNMEDWFGSVSLMVTAKDSGYDGIPGTPDDLGVSSNAFNLTVLPTNDAPVIDTPDNTAATETVWYYGNYTGHDIDGDQLTWALSSNATWLDMDLGNLSGLPPIGSAGPYFVNLTLLDNNNSMAFSNFTLIVGKTNLLPHFNATVPDVVFPEDSFFVLDVSLYCCDPENDELVCYLTGKDSTLFTVTGENTSTKLTFTGLPNRYGQSKATLWIGEGPFISASQEIWVNITPVDDPPVAQPITLLTQYKGNLTAVLGTGQATDIDSTRLTYWWFFGDGEGSYGLDLVIKHTYPAPGNYTVELLISDGEMTDTTNLTIEVIGLPPNITDDDDVDDDIDDDIVTDDDDNETEEGMPRYVYYIAAGAVVALVLIIVVVILVVRSKAKARRDEVETEDRQREEEERDLDRDMKAAYEARDQTQTDIGPQVKQSPAVPEGQKPSLEPQAPAGLDVESVATKEEDAAQPAAETEDEEEISADELSDLEDGLVEEEKSGDAKAKDEGAPEGQEETVEAEGVAEVPGPEGGDNERSNTDVQAAAQEDEEVVELTPIQMDDEEPEKVEGKEQEAKEESNEVEYEEDEASEDDDEDEVEEDVEDDDEDDEERDDDEEEDDEDKDEAWKTKDLEYS